MWLVRDSSHFLRGLMSQTKAKRPSDDEDEPILQQNDVG